MIITKQDRTQLLTDFKKVFATKQELAATDIHLETKIEDSENKILAKLDKKFDEVMNHIDVFAGMTKDNEEERTLISERLSDHEDRIEKLEKAQDQYTAS
jgi:hypothetical protein